MLRGPIMQGTAKRGKTAAKKQQAIANLGQIAWDQLFVEGEIV